MRIMMFFTFYLSSFSTPSINSAFSSVRLTHSSTSTRWVFSPLVTWGDTTSSCLISQSILARCIIGLWYRKCHISEMPHIRRRNWTCWTLPPERPASSCLLTLTPVFRPDSFISWHIQPECISGGIFVYASELDKMPLLPVFEPRIQWSTQGCWQLISIFQLVSWSCKSPCFRY